MLQNKTYNILTCFLFSGLWALVIYRSISLPLIHDEIATKWSYILNWNPLPYMGYLDANNHFLNSFLSGLIYKLTGSDHPFFLRLPNVLAFPLFFWSAYKLSQFWLYKESRLLLVLSLSVCFFFLDFFCLCRGYGLSMAFLVWTFYHLVSLQAAFKLKHLLLALTGLMLMTTANLALIPLALIGFLHLLVTVVLRKSYSQLLAFVLPLALISYLVFYSLDLSSSGKLYLGSSDGFFNTTVHSLSEYIIGFHHWSIDVLYVLLTASIFYLSFKEIAHNGLKPSPRMLPLLYFSAYLLSILLQSVILGINYPEHRSALGLAVLFFLSIPQLIEKFNLKKLAIAFSVVFLALFISQASLKDHYAYWFDNFNEELISRIPPKTLGTPSSTYGEYWRMDNEISRTSELPTYMFQLKQSAEDTLADYLVQHGSLDSALVGTYTQMYTDPVSNKTLYRRKTLLKRTECKKHSLELNGTNMTFPILEQSQIEPTLFSVSLALENLSILDNFILVCSVQDSVSNELLNFTKLPLLQSTKLSKNNSLSLDISIVMPVYSPVQKTKIYIWNMDQKPTKGTLEVDAYTLK